MNMARGEALNMPRERDRTFARNAREALPDIAVCGPFGAAKERCAGLCARTMAERGFLTVAFAPSFTGESSGQPRYMASPGINAEDSMAAARIALRDRVDVIPVDGIAAFLSAHPA